MEPSAASAVYLDVVVDDGLLFFELVNAGAEPVHAVRVRFSEAVIGAADTDIAGLGLFRRTEFLAPHKRVRVFVDTAHSYFERRQPTRLAVRVSWRRGDRPLSFEILHDLEMYRDLPSIVEQVHQPPPRLGGRGPGRLT